MGWSQSGWLQKVGAELEKAARGTRGVCGHFFRIEDISVQKPSIYIVIADLCGDFIHFEVNIEE